MNREEILAKSRAENQNRDIYEKEVLKRGQAAASVVLVSFSTLFFILQILAGGGINYGLYVMVFSAQTAVFWVRYRYFRRRQDLFFALAESGFVIALTVAHLYNLFSA